MNNLVADSVLVFDIFYIRTTDRVTMLQYGTNGNQPIFPNHMIATNSIVSNGHVVCHNCQKGSDMQRPSFTDLVNGAPAGRFDGIARTYTPEDVLRLSGSFHVRHSLAERGANRLWQL